MRYGSQCEVRVCSAENYEKRERAGVPFPPPPNPRFTFADLFAGIGGMRIAFQSLGGLCVFSSDCDKFAQITYATNFGDVPWGDITQIAETDIPDHDILLAGFPCQAFSMAGKRKGFEDTRGTLFFEVVRILRAKVPRAFLLENVKGLVTHRKGETLKSVVGILHDDLGYHVLPPKLFNAKDFGVPQNRERVFVVGFRERKHAGRFVFPVPVKKPVWFGQVKETGTVSPKYYLSVRYLESLYRHKARNEKKGNGFGFAIVHDRSVANTLVAGGMGRERNLVVDRKLEGMISVKGGEIQINREGLRRMTPREWARLQGFPEEFRIVVSDSQAYKQFANSVAVPVVRAIGEQMVKAIFDS